MTRSPLATRVAAALTCAAAAVALACAGHDAAHDVAAADAWGSVVTGAARTPLPAPRMPQTDDSAPAAYAGAATCVACHAEQSAPWARSTHGQAGGAPSAARVIAPFGGAPIRFRDATVVPAASGGRYTFTIRRDGESDVVDTVDAVIGGGRMQGGGTQGFATRWRDGTVRFLPFDWSRHGATWFCNTDTRGGHGWVPITADLPLAACADWPPARVLGDESRFTNCQSCHASRATVRLDTAAHAWRTSWATLAIDCESCHGPARAHVDAERAGRGTTPAMLRALATLDRDASSDVCLQCHAVKARLTGVGAATAPRYSAPLALLGDSLFHADGRTRTFAYQEGQRWSDCAVNGGMRCTSCHDPHTQSYRDAFGVPLPVRDADGQCTSCHASIGAHPAAHTRHAAGSPGSRCVACHMPYLQQPAVGTGVRYGRSDHTIAIPRPGHDAAEGVPNACAACHTGRTAAQLDADVARLWGTIKPLPATVAAIERAASVTDAAEAGRLLLDTTTRHAAAQYAALAAYVERYLAPDMPALDADAARRLGALARARDADVRALALAGLHYAGGERAGVRATLAAALARDTADGLLRARWATALGTLADVRAGRGDPRGAATTYAKALEVQPGDARLLLNLGLAQAAGGDPARAAETYRAALASDPRQPLAHVNLGVAQEALSDTAGAVASYERALALNAYEPLALANLGNVALRAGRPADAVPLYERALAVDPSLASVEFALAQAVGQLGDYPRALRELRRGLAFDSSDAQVRALAATLAERLAPVGRRR